MFPLSLVSGVIFTLIGAALRRVRDSEIEAAGDLTLANTSGAALGSLIGGFVLLPVLGREASFMVIALLYGANGLLLMLTTSVPRRLITGAVAVVCCSASRGCLLEAWETSPRFARDEVRIREAVSR